MIPDQKILVLVHVEETFRRFFWPGFLKNIRRYIKNGNFNEVIHFTSHINDYDPVDEILPLITRHEEWSWGYEPEVFHERKERQWCIKSIGHEYTWVPPIFRNRNIWKRTHIYLGGGYNYECLADMESVLRYQRIKYLKCDRIVY
jgi:hypothetical protein